MNFLGKVEQKKKLNVLAFFTLSCSASEAEALLLPDSSLTKTVYSQISCYLPSSSRCIFLYALIFQILPLTAHDHYSFSVATRMPSFPFFFSPLAFEDRDKLEKRQAASVSCLNLSVSVLHSVPFWVPAVLLSLAFPLIGFPWNFSDAWPQFSQTYLPEVCCLFC